MPSSLIGRLGDAISAPLLRTAGGILTGTASAAFGRNNAGGGIGYNLGRAVGGAINITARTAGRGVKAAGKGAWNRLMPGPNMVSPNRTGLDRFLFGRNGDETRSALTGLLSTADPNGRNFGNLFTGRNPAPWLIGGGVVLGGLAIASSSGNSRYSENAVEATPYNKMQQLSYSGNNLRSLRGEDLGVTGDLGFALHNGRHGGR